ncbi:MAG: sigma-70 family RNA polymerase sigma factor, partial [Clostridiales bacterium]|nr:sigma-70 family RNA polymerase sigma factor [Candidatus Apopatousia equi]
MQNYEETLKLIMLAKSGDEDAKTELITKNSPLIKSVIKPYKFKGVEYDDLYQLGCLGFIKAIQNFDPKFNTKFSTYAVPMVAGEVKRFLRDDGSIKVSRALKSLNIQINRYILEFKAKNFDENPSIDEIAKHFNMDKQEIVFAMDSKKALLSLDEKQDENNPRSRSIMESVEEIDACENMLNDIVLKDIISALPSREKKIIALRYFEDRTQSEIAEKLGVSQVQVSRLE